MRIVPLLVLLLCWLSGPVASDLPTGMPTARTIAGDADEAEYQALQRQANLALDALREAERQRLAAN